MEKISEKRRQQLRKAANKWYQKNKNDPKLIEYKKKQNDLSSHYKGICSVCKTEIFGKKNKKLCKKCFSNSFRGNQYWKERKVVQGKDHWSWKGGLTFWRKRIWDSSKYKNWRKSCMERDYFTCQWCDKKGGYLEVHHHQIGFADLLRKLNINSKQEADVCDELWKLELGITLCRKCHDKTKNNGFKAPQR